MGAGKGKTRRVLRVAPRDATSLSAGVINNAAPLSEGILMADAAVAESGDLRDGARIYDAYLNEALRNSLTPKLPRYHIDTDKSELLLKKLYLAEREILHGQVERALSFHSDGQLWYYNIGNDHESDMGIYPGLIVTHNHPPRSDGRSTSTFSPADVDTMAVYRKDGHYLQEMRAVDPSFLCSMRRQREPRGNDLRIGRQMAKLHPDYVDYSEEEREKLHELLTELAPRAGIVYTRIPLPRV